MKRLLIESSVLGLLAAFFFPFYNAISFRPVPYLAYGELIEIVPLCIVSSVILALVFRKRFVRGDAVV